MQSRIKQKSFKCIAYGHENGIRDELYYTKAMLAKHIKGIANQMTIKQNSDFSLLV